MDNKKFITIIIVLLLGAGISFILRPITIDDSSDERIFNFPKEINGYKGTDVVLKARIYEILETKNVIMRNYEKTGKSSILFYLIFAKETYKTSDPPENCIQGDGGTILGKAKGVIHTDLRDLAVNKLVVEQKGKKYLYLYWFLAGDVFTDSYVTQRIALMSAYLKRAPLAGGQIRISTEIENNDESAAFRELQGFINGSMPELLKLLK